ncbi:MAG TPA: hypothetical protein VEB21_11920 [Terriglobales bacterium]|nr:hypothetical protein [Terriglobales bacterium]
MAVGLVAVVGTGCSTHDDTAYLIAPPPRTAAVAVAMPAPTSAPTPAAVRVPPLGSAKYRVCAFAFHSPYELDAIKAALPPGDFVFTDLTPVAPAMSGTAPGTQTLPPGWLTDRCRPDLRCDIVVLSGEFAGTFFGDYGASLELQEMEEASCQPSCQGLFRDPREVFLLGCNTLATKGADDRTRADYLHVLYTHGFDRAAAERVVDQRYGGLGPSFKESMRRIFLGVPRIYGFSSVAPTGDKTAPWLTEYFRRKGDYARYLTEAGRSTASNRDLLAAFGHSAVVQTTGLSPADAVAADRNKVCRLYDDAASLGERLRIVHSLLDRDDFLTFVPPVEIFLSRNPPERFQSPEEQHLFRQVQALEKPRQQMKATMNRLHASVLKMQIAHLAMQLGWLGGEEFRRLAAESAKQLLGEPVSYEVADIACEVVKYGQVGTGIRSEEVPDHIFLHWEGFRMLDCLSPADARLSTRMAPGLRHHDEWVRFWAAHALSRRLPLSDGVLAAVAESLNDPSLRVRERVRWILQTQPPLTAQALAAVRLRDPELARSLEARRREAQR